MKENTKVAGVSPSGALDAAFSNFKKNFKKHFY